MVNLAFLQTPSSPTTFDPYLSPQPFSGSHFLKGGEESKEITALLRQILPPEYISSQEPLINWLPDFLPHIKRKSHPHNPYRQTLILFCFASNDLKQEEFFQEMIKHHLIPGQEVSITSFRCYRFYLKGFTSKLLFLTEVNVSLHEKNALELLLQNFPLFSQTILLGCSSSQAARHTTTNSLLFSRNSLLNSQKYKLYHIEKDLNKLMKRFPYIFESDLLHECGCFLSLTQPAFLQLRPSRLLSRIIAIQFLARRSLKRALLIAPEKRHLHFHFFPSCLQSTFGKKMVLGLLITISLENKHEHFDEEHLLLAIQKWMPHINIVQGSRYLYRNPQEDSLCTLYVELDKEDGSPFSLSEKQKLRKILSQELKERVQRLMPSLFAVRNEEQVMKNIILLSRELDSPFCIPQMMLSFEKQTDTALIFTMILLYVGDQKGNSIEESLQTGLNSFAEVILERKEVVGYLKEGLAKEAAVFRIQMATTNDLLRKDFSVNVYQARQKVSNAINKALGHIRDYDGGLILKQQELFSRLQESFSDLDKEKNELLENFFYGIVPIEKQATLSLKVLSSLFSLALKSLEKNFSSTECYNLLVKEEEAQLHICVRADNASLKKHLNKKIGPLTTPAHRVISTTFHYQDSYGWTYLIGASEKQIRDQYLDVIKSAIEEWLQEKKEFQVLRLSVGYTPISLDPRLAGDGESKEMLLLLYEGLMRIGSTGKAECALAESYEISSDQKVYTFHLRNCKWANGMSMQAQDFEYAWKSILSPEFKTPFAHFFYHIKNAKEAKKNLLPLDQVGIRSLDKQTLQVELEYPLPYFLEILAEPLFSPVNPTIDRVHPQWATTEGDTFICNGPFRLVKNRPEKEYILEKNPLYWEAQKVQLSRIIFSKTNGRTALEMFKNGELDWLGRPVRPWESFFELAKTEGTMVELPFGQAYWCTFNVRSLPLKSAKLRQALSLALNRREIVEALGDGIPAFSPLPLFHTQYLQSGAEESYEQALKLFEEALKELHFSRGTFPALQLIFPEGEKREKISTILRQQWKQVLGIEIHLQSYSWSSLFHCVTKGNYEMACIGWQPYVNDALDTLNIFKSETDELNFPKWEHPEFKEWINKALVEQDINVRSQYYARAEAILIKEVPVVPLIYEKELGIKKPTLKIDTPQSSVDFRKAYFLN